MKIDIYNTENKYSIIYADSPWRYNDNKCAGACEKHYETMNISDMCKLPIQNIVADDCILFMWATYPQLESALDLIKAWGFTYKSIAFQWVKLNRGVTERKLQIATAKDFCKLFCFFGLGRWTRGNTECCLIATKGKPKRLSAKVSQLIFAPLTKHSEKPKETRDKIFQLMGDLPRIELFARESVTGWDCWGNEA